MPAGINYRIFYAVQQIGFSKIGQQSFIPAHGVQSVGITTNFNLDRVFELGQISIYENIEQIPDVEVTAEKVLDGYPLLYHLATNGSSSATLAGRGNAKTIVALSVFSDVQDAASGTPIAEVQMSGLYTQSLNYRFPVQGNFTESITLIGNHKMWKTSGFTFTGAFNNTDAPFGASASGGVNRRENMLFTYPANPGLDVNNQVNVTTATVLPPDIDGISSSGTNDKSGGDFLAHVQDISISTNLGREELFEQGRRAPYYRYINFPVEVTTEINVISVKYDAVSATEEGVLATGDNLSNRTIKIKCQESSFFNLGTKNKLASVRFAGGDAGGGNVVSTYTYSNFNDLTITHSNDPSGL